MKLFCKVVGQANFHTTRANCHRMHMPLLSWPEGLQSKFRGGIYSCLGIVVVWCRYSVMFKECKPPGRSTDRSNEGAKTTAMTTN